MVEEGITDGMSHNHEYHVIHRYAKANNKYIRDYDQNKQLSYLMYWDVNNLYRWVITCRRL